MNGDALLFFDGECRLCRRAVAILARWDRRDRIVMLPFQHPLTSRLLPDVTPEELDVLGHLATTAVAQAVRGAVSD